MSKTNSKNTWKKTLALITDYFLNSDEKLKAWLLLIGAILCVIGLVAVMAALSWWSAGFWAVLTAKALTPFLISMAQFALLLSAYVGAYVLKNYFIGKLSVLWRNWLTKKMINELFGSENNYLELRRFSSEIDNIAQRIQEDIQVIVDFTLSLATDFLQSVLSFGTFVGSLWVIGGALTIVILGLNIVIPGYLVWVALLVAITATVITHFIGKSLPEVNKMAEQAEADFRQDLTQLCGEAENIAEEHAEIYYQTSITNKIEQIKKTSNQKLNTEAKLSSFQSFYLQLAGILPNILAAPLYFTGLIDLAQLMQIGMSFTQVNFSLSWFVTAFENLSTNQASIERILELKDAFEEGGLATNPKAITRKIRSKETIKIKHLDIMPPQASSTEYIMRNLNLKLKPGENVLLQAESGIGKSTLFKAIAGVWQYGNGKISTPEGKSFYFLPQRPTLPCDTLRAVLAYPEPADTYDDQQYISVLEKVKMDKFISKLDEINPWAVQLSGGEQQRIAFARVLLKKPDWLFLDEATSSLDEKNEDHVYKMVRELPNTTFISIGHRYLTLAPHHSKAVFFNLTNDRNIEVSEVYLGNSNSRTVA
ncbi:MULTISPECIES: ABC transporter ATP-binding protein/permease [Legionella]|uniref:ABC transporter n=1 Tax=Legionella drozanskii LLAP-1 TaxID=1212489 RepID=A0A0W0SKT9_9GAMM|nr:MULTISPECIES: ABC transporter ATP-binding protein/permease [Legionella]KTC84026.1 ABC transporter [Legionella drozanskii LLAP-1]PJE14844.1 MAG: ABC transporter [Legionella sp.]